MALSPPLAADPEAKAVCLTALSTVDAQPGYVARYKADVKKAGSDPVVQNGKAIRQGALFYREGYRVEKKELKEGQKASIRLYRGNGRLAVYEPRLERWLTGEQAGDATQGKGLEDPDVALAFLREALVDATRGKAEAEGDVYELKLDRLKLSKKVQEHTDAADDLDWERSDVSAMVILGGTPSLPRRFVINGVLPSRKSGEGHVTLHIEVDVDDYGDQPLLEKMPKDAREILEVK